MLEYFVIGPAKTEIAQKSTKLILMTGHEPYLF